MAWLKLLTLFSFISKGLSSLRSLFSKRKERPPSSSSTTINNYGTIDKVVNVYILNSEEADKVMDKVTKEQMKTKQDDRRKNKTR